MVRGDHLRQFTHVFLVQPVKCNHNFYVKLCSYLSLLLQHQTFVFLSGSPIFRDEIEVKKKKRNTFLIKISKVVFDFFENIVPSICFFLGFI